MRDSATLSYPRQRQDTWKLLRKLTQKKEGIRKEEGRAIHEKRECVGDQNKKLHQFGEIEEVGKYVVREDTWDQKTKKQKLEIKQSGARQ